RQRLARRDGELHPVHDGHAATFRREGDGQPVDRQKGCAEGRAHWVSLRVRGSAMSRMASAIVFTERTRVKSSTAAAARFHQMTGVRESSLRAWSIIWPQLPSMPTPR